MKFGVQLYSLRHLVDSIGVDGILKLVADSGFECVEFAGFYGKSVEQIVELTQKYNLKSYSAHTDFAEIESQLPYYKALGIKKLYIPWVSADGLQGANFDVLVDKLKSAQKFLFENGISLGYHNHDQEYANGGDRIKEMLDLVDGLYSEMDIFWVKESGNSAVKKLEEYNGRVNCLHIKEMDERTTTDPWQYANPIVGDGISDVKQVFSAAKKLNIPLAILEVESFCIDEKTYLTKSLAAMKSFL